MRSKKVINSLLVTSLVIPTVITINTDTVQAVETETWNFSYTGNYQKWIVPKNGIYKLETWGAEGGADSTTLGGKGGYASGEVSLREGQVIYIYVGGKGASSTNNATGGWNGGGNGGVVGSSGGGGGSTDIRLSTSLDSRFLVAGGGGGAGHQGVGGSGGGYEGLDGANSTVNGATQTSGGTSSYGSGTLLEGGDHTGDGGGGGGGYYGGGAGNGDYGGGGGSSYTGTLENATTISGSLSMPSPTIGATEIGHRGNGFTRITFVENDYEYMVKVIGTFEATTIDVKIPAMTTFLYNPNTEVMTAQNMGVQNDTNAPVYVKMDTIAVAEESVWKPNLVAPTIYNEEQWNNLTLSQTKAEVALGLLSVDSENWLNVKDSDIWSTTDDNDRKVGAVKTKSSIEIMPLLKAGTALTTEEVLTANYVFEFGLE